MLKEPATYCQQIAKLREHGCTVSDDAFCKEVLSRVGYYRLSAYFQTFWLQDSFMPETNFNKIYKLYEFDRQLRRFLFSILEELEVYLRVKLSYYHSHRYGSDGYMNPSNFNYRHNHRDFSMRLNDLIKGNNKLPFVNHHINKYGSKFPLWVIVELFTFGMLSYFYAEMLTPDQKKLAHNVFKASVSETKSWLYCCTNLRNICAHSRRLYNSVFSVIPANIPHIDKFSERKLFAAVMAVRALYPNTDKWNNELLPNLATLFKEYSDVISLKFIGFPTDWKTIMPK